MVVQCCQCKKVRITTPNDSRMRWVDSGSVDFDPSDASHGYCPPCTKKAYAEIQAYNRNAQLLASHA